MARITQDRTTVVIAHRLSTVRHADWIVVMEQGRIVEQEPREPGGPWGHLHQPLASPGRRRAYRFLKLALLGAGALTMLGPQAGGAAMAMEASISHVMHHPLGVFSLLVAISAAVPPLIRRVGLPDLVGLLAAGVLVAPMP